MKNTITLLVVYLAGSLFDFGAYLSFLIKFLLMALLFFSFLKVNRINKPEFGKLFLILSFMFIVGGAAFFSLFYYDKELAVSALMVCIAPTALASIVVIDILGGDKSHAAANVIVINVVIVFIMPLLSFFINDSIGILNLLKSICSTIIIFFLPLITALIVRRKVKLLTLLITKFNFSFYVWSGLMFLSVSKSAYFLKHNSSININIIISLIFIVFVLCFINFFVGRMIGGNRTSLESSIALGHKNNGFTVWFCLTYINPFVALGPAVYVLFQNLYLIFLVSRKKRS